MKRFYLPLTTAVVVSMALTSCGGKVGCPFSGNKAQLKTDVDSMSYAIGVVNGVGFQKSLKNIPGGNINIGDLVSGFVSAIQEQDTKITEEEAQDILQSYFTKVQEKIAAENKAEGEKFLAENKTQEGVKETESGLQYKVLKEGNGVTPKDEDKVKVNYRGTLVNGEEFDKGDSITFPVTRVIKGWTEGLKLMKVGSRYEFYIPSELAYGERGAGPKIKPNSTLIFEVELLDIIKEAPKKEAPKNIKKRK